MSWLNDWILTLIIFLPVVGVGLICLVPSAAAATVVVRMRAAVKVQNFTVFASELVTLASRFNT